MTLRRSLLALATISASVMTTSLTVNAQGAKFPERPIRLVVPFAAGGGVDVFARLIADKIKQTQGHTIVVENRAGASGTVGGLSVKNAEADGYSVLFSAATHVMARQVMKNAPYDPVTEFSFIARVGEAPMLLVMAPNRSPKSVADLVKEMRAAPDKWTAATAALGAPGHLATIAFSQGAGAKLTILPYRGTAPALTDVAGGHVQLLIDPVVALLPMANEKKVVGLAVTSAKRTKLAPQYPTIAESGLAGFDHASWYGLWGPKALAEDLVAKLHGVFDGAVKELDKEGRLAKIGVDAVSETPAQFAAFAKGYVTRNAELLKAAQFEPL